MSEHTDILKSLSLLMPSLAVPLRHSPQMTAKYVVAIEHAITLESLLATANEQIASLKASASNDADVLEAFNVRLTVANERVKELEAFLTRNGFRQCDIAACNCGSYHGGHASDRLREISDEVWENGKTILQSVIDLKKANEQLTARAVRAERDAERYRFLRWRLYQIGTLDIGEAYVTMKVVGVYPVPDDWDEAIDAARKEVKGT